MDNIRLAAGKIIVGLDVRGAMTARDLILQLPDCSVFKIGPHFRYDPWACAELFDRDFRDGFADEVRENPLWFDDSKLFDIDITVERAVDNLAYRVNELTGHKQFAFVTVHAHEPTLRAAVKAAAGTQLKIIAVPLMTSFDQVDLLRFYNYPGEPIDFVVERVRRAVDCGCDGTICSAEEVGMLRGNVVPRDFLLIVPGSAGGADHKRTGSPAQAIRDGADHLVLSRSIIEAVDRRAAFGQIVSAIAAVLPV